MIISILFFVISLLLDLILRCFFPMDIFLSGIVFTPSLSLFAVALSARDMKQLDSVLWSILAGMMYGFLIGSDALQFAIIFLVVNFMVRLWTKHLFNSVLECMVICMASLFMKDFLVYISALFFYDTNLHFVTWIMQYESTNLLVHIALCGLAIALYYQKIKWSKHRDGTLKQNEKIHWYELNQ